MATFDSGKSPDILDELVTVTDQDVLTHAQATATDHTVLTTLFDKTTDIEAAEETASAFVDLQYFYPLEEEEEDDEENSIKSTDFNDKFDLEINSPKSEVDTNITDLSSIIQIGQTHSTPPPMDFDVLLPAPPRIVFEPILSPPPPPPIQSSPIEEKSQQIEQSTPNEQYSPIPSVKLKLHSIQLDDQDKSSSEPIREPLKIKIRTKLSLPSQSSSPSLPKLKIRKKAKQRKSSPSPINEQKHADYSQLYHSSLNPQIPPTPGEHEDLTVQLTNSDEYSDVKFNGTSTKIYSHLFNNCNDEQMLKTTFITPPPDNDNHLQQSTDDQYQHSKKVKKNHLKSSIDPYSQPYPIHILPIPLHHSFISHFLILISLHLLLLLLLFLLLLIQSNIIIIQFIPILNNRHILIHPIYIHKQRHILRIPIICVSDNEHFNGNGNLFSLASRDHHLYKR